MTRAAERLAQIKKQLNLSPSTMSLQAPKDMAEERAKASFDIQALSYLWAGNEEKFKRKKRAFDIIAKDPALVVQTPQNILEFSRDQMREFTMGQIYRMLQLTHDIQDKELLQDIHLALSIYSPSYNMRTGVHETLFRNVIQMLGNKQQNEKWLDSIASCEIFGCFAMTELGHSSALKEIETTATFDANNDAFIIHSPSITSTKWWMGMAGHTATHAVVIAQTYTQGSHIGLNWFVVPLRDTVTGKPLPGVDVGDLGHKVGHQGVDNGWIQFHQVRIPRTYMLSRWCSVDQNGQVSHTATNPVVMYATLIPERIGLVPMTCALAIQALIITSRYGVVRRQGGRQIMDYQSHYAKLIPATAFMYMAQNSLEVLDEQLKLLMVTGDSNKMDPKKYVDHMSDMHCISAALKGMSGFYCMEILETCRRACGGHAYSTYNALGSLMNDLSVMTTGGGDNVVLLQQAAHHLLGLISNNKKRHPVLQYKSSTDYLKRAKELLAKEKWQVGNMSECVNNLELMEEAIQTILIKKLNSIQISMKEGVPRDDLLLEFVRIAELHCALFLFSTNMDKCAALSHKQDATFGILKKMTAVWGLYTLQKYGDEGFLEGYLDPQHIKDIKEEFLKLCKEMRYDIIGLTDAFGLPDFILKAPIAKYDGNIYQAYFETVLQAQGSVDVPAYHEKYIKPLTSKYNLN